MLRAMTKRAVALGIALGLGAVVATASGASAQGMRRVAVVDFEGPGGSQARAAVVDALSGEVDLVPGPEVAAAAEQAGDNLPRLAANLRADLLVTGVVSGRGRRARTRLRVLDANGVELAQGRAGSPAGRGGRRVGQAASEAVQQAIRTLDARDASGVEAPPPGTGSGFGVDTGEGEGEGEEPEAETESRDPPMLLAVAGLGLRTRSATVNLVSGATRNYSAGAFAELVVHAELRPLARSTGAAKGLFAALDLGIAVGLSSSTPDASGIAMDVSTSALQFAGEVGFVYGLADGMVELGVALGGGIDSFTLGTNMVLPSTSYSYLRPALVATFGIVPDWLRLGLEAGYRLVFGTGDILDQFGEQVTSGGLDVGLAATGGTGLFAYSLRLGYVHYSLSFSGVGLDADATDGGDGSFFVSALAGVRL